MVKKYSQNPKDRKDESMGMKKYEMRKGKGYMDSQFYGMISEDHLAPANLPQDVVHKRYPKCKYLGGYEIDDTIHGLDDTRTDDIRNLEANQSEVKY